MHIDHITIRTDKLDGSIDFYEKVAGLRIVREGSRRRHETGQQNA